MKSTAATKGEQTRQAILDAAIVRFGRDGFRATSVADIARDAGVGGTVAYAYFENKEALFFAAMDSDAAGIISEGLIHIVEGSSTNAWRETLVIELLASVDRHPLARRALAGLEPDATERILELPSLNDLRAACADRIRSEQASGSVRGDIDAVAMANGIVSIMLSLLMSVTQVGVNTALRYRADVAAVFAAALDPPR